MTREEIIQIYCQVSDELCGGAEWCWSGVSGPLEKFAALVAAHEREACAKVVEESSLPDVYSEPALLDIAEAIRARGQE